ncbi:hypothetical protein BGZ76_011912 [Entomortierella beljakovae]|nr:hypothetical protein BGZ76_011912 [Entomortierella beljakovae]
MSLPLTKIGNLSFKTSIYGIEERIVLDIGSCYLKCGLSGEARPRHFISMFLSEAALDDYLGLKPVHQPHFGHDCNEYCNERTNKTCRGPNPLEVPSISFTNAHLLALLTTGTSTGLVIDCGHLETSVLPIYSSRPMTPFILTTPRAGKFLSTHLKYLLREKCPISLADNPTDLRIIPEGMLTSAFLETIKTRLLFASPLIVNARDNVNEEEMNNNYRDLSTSTEVHVEVWLEEEQARGIMAIPGWLRERASECLFNGDEDAQSITDTILGSILKSPSDLRRQLISSMLLIGGTAQLPNLQSRLLQEIKRSLQTNPRWKVLSGLADSARFLDDLTDEDKASLSMSVGFVGGRSSHQSIMDFESESATAGATSTSSLRDKDKRGSKDKKSYQSSGKVFMPNCRAWIGGSLVGSLKASGPETFREGFNGSVPDWSTTVSTASSGIQRDSASNIAVSSF